MSCRTTGSAALRQGVTRAEIIEVILQASVYAGV
ncbi:MAG: carboxymuconolactone decarboxylase family protein [Pseudomonadota bacterium]